MLPHLANGQENDDFQAYPQADDFPQEGAGYWYFKSEGFSAVSRVRDCGIESDVSDRGVTTSSVLHKALKRLADK